MTAPDLSTPNSRRPALDYRRSSSLGFGLVVPVHPPKMSELCNLVHSNVPFSIPLWAVLSRREHASLLRCHVDWFVIPEFVGNLSQAERSHKNTNIPTKKKWMAIKYVFDNFPSMPTLVALDAESTVLRPLAMRDVHEFESDMAIVTYGVQPATRLFGEINARSCRAVHLPPIRHAAYMWWRGAHLPSPRFRRLLPTRRLGCTAEPAQSCVRSHLIPVLPIPRARLEAGSREFVARAAALPHTRRAPPAHVAAAPANTVRSRRTLGLRSTLIVSRATVKKTQVVLPLRRGLPRRLPITKATGAQQAGSTCLPLLLPQGRRRLKPPCPCVQLSGVLGPPGG